jgi:INO80 complex subunit C
MDAPVSVSPRKRYCDITGFKTNYKDAESGMYFKDSGVLQYLRTLNKAVKEYYVKMRDPPVVQNF